MAYEHTHEMRFFKCTMLKLGAARLELANSEEGGFTVPCNCRYATPPKMGKRMLEKGLEPSTVRLQVGRSTN